MIAYAALAVPLVVPAGLGDGVASLKGHHPTRYEPSFLSKLEPAPHLLSCSVDLPILVFDTNRDPHRGMDRFADNLNHKNGCGDSFYGPAAPYWCQARGSAKAYLGGVVTADEGKPVRYEGYVILFFILSKDQVQCEKSATAFCCKPKRKSWSGCSASSGYSRR